MKLGQWMHGWRDGGDPEPHPGGHLLAAMQTNAAATLRYVLNLLPEQADAAPPTREVEELERLLAEVEKCGLTLHESQLQYSAGQMRLLWRSVREGTLRLDEPIVSAMSQCVLYLLDHLTAGRPFPHDAAEMDTWNRVYQVAMANQVPLTPEAAAAHPEPPPPPRVSVTPARPLDPVPAGPAARWDGTDRDGNGTTQSAPEQRTAHPVIRGPLRLPDPSALDADELERLLVARRGDADRPMDARV